MGRLLRILSCSSNSRNAVECLIMGMISDRWIDILSVVIFYALNASLFCAWPDEASQGETSEKNATMLTEKRKSPIR